MGEQIWFQLKATFVKSYQRQNPVRKLLQYLRKSQCEGASEQAPFIIPLYTQFVQFLGFLVFMYIMYIYYTFDLFFFQNITLYSMSCETSTVLSFCNSLFYPPVGLSNISWT